MGNNQLFDWLSPFYDRLIPPPDPERLLSLLELPGSTGWMLDAAGGTGRVAERVRPLVERLVVCDLSAGMLRQAARKSGFYPAQGQVERLPFADGVFTRVLVVDAFHHFADQEGAARELARVLAPGGRLVIEEPDVRHFSTRLIALGETVMLMGSHFRSPDWICTRLEANGLKARVETSSPTVWVIGTK